MNSDDVALRPQARMPKVIALTFAVAGAIAIVVAAFLHIGQQSFSQQRAIESVVIILIGGAVIVWLVAECRRIWAIELNEKGASALAWEWRPFPKLRPIHISWPNVQRVGVSGFLLIIEEGRLRVTINTLLFEDPEKVREFVRTHVKGAS